MNAAPGIAAHLRGLEEVGVERDRLLDVVDLESDVVDPYEMWLHAAANDGGRRLHARPESGDAE